MAYVVVPDSDLDAESPIKTGVMTKLRDNIDALYEDTRASAYKTADETVTASAVLQDDNHLSFTAGASEVWVAHLYLLVTTTHNDGDLKIQITTPGGGATGYVQGIAYDAGIGATAGGAVDAACDVNYTAAVTTDPLYVTAYITTVTGGTVKLQWCQRTANGTTTLLTGSWLMAFRTDAL